MKISSKLHSLLTWIFIVAIALLSIAAYPFEGTTIVGVLVLLFLFIYLVLAPANIFFTFVKEGTAKAVVRGDGFKKMLIQWNGYKLDAEGNVVPGKKFHLFGGLRFYGIWLIDKIYTYKFEWKGLEPDGITPRVHPVEILDNIFLKQYVYFSEVKEAEDSKRLPLNVHYVLTIQIQNPYKAFFRVHNWLAVTFGRVAPEIRNVIAQGEYKDLIANLEDVAKKIKDNVAKDSRADTIVQILKRDYGIEVLDIKVLTIDPPGTMRDATLLEFVADQNKKRIEIEAEAEKKKRILEAEGEALAYKVKVDALGGGNQGIQNLVTIEVSKNIKSGDKIIAGDILEAFKGFAGSIPQGWRGPVRLIASPEEWARGGR